MGSTKARLQERTVSAPRPLLAQRPSSMAGRYLLPRGIALANRVGRTKALFQPSRRTLVSNPLPTDEAGIFAFDLGRTTPRSRSAAQLSPIDEPTTMMPLTTAGGDVT